MTHKLKFMIGEVICNCSHICTFISVDYGGDEFTYSTEAWMRYIKLS